MQTRRADCALNSFLERYSVHKAIAKLYGCSLRWVGLEEGVHLKVVLYRPRPTCCCDRPECGGSNNSIDHLGTGWNSVLLLRSGHLMDWVSQLVRPVGIVDARGDVLDKREPPDMVRLKFTLAAAAVTRHICIQLLAQPGLLPAALPDSAVAQILSVCRSTVSCPLLFRLNILPLTASAFAQTCTDLSLAAARLMIHSPPAVLTGPQGSTSPSSMAALLYSMEYLQPVRAGRQEVVAALHRLLHTAGWQGPQADAAHPSAGLSSPPGTTAGRLDLPRDLEEAVAAALMEQWALHLDSVVAAAACGTAAAARHTAVCVLCGQSSGAQLVRCRKCVHSYHTSCVDTKLYSPDLQQLHPAPGGDTGLCLCCQHFPIRKEVEQGWLQLFEKAGKLLGHAPAASPAPCQQLQRTCGGNSTDHVQQAPAQQLPCLLVHSQTDLAPAGMHRSHDIIIPSSQSDEEELHLSAAAPAGPCQPASAGPGPQAPGQQWQLHGGACLTAQQSSQQQQHSSGDQVLSRHGDEPTAPVPWMGVQQQQAVQPAHQADVCTAASSLPTPDVGQQQLGSAGGATHMQHSGMPYACVSIAHVNAPQQHMLQVQGQMQQLVSQASTVVPCSAVHHQLHKLLLPQPSPNTQAPIQAPMQAQNLQIAGALLLLFLPLADAKGGNAWDRSVRLLRQDVSTADCVAGMQHLLQSVSQCVPAGAAPDVVLVATSTFGHGMWGPAPGLVWDWDAVTADALSALVSLLRAQLASSGTNTPLVCVQLHLQCFCRLWSTAARAELENASFRRRVMLGMLVHTSNCMVAPMQLVHAAAGPAAPSAPDHSKAYQGSQLGAGGSVDCGSMAAAGTLCGSHSLQSLPAEVAAAVRIWGEAPEALAAAVKLLAEQCRMTSMVERTGTSSLDVGGKHRLGKDIVLELQQLLADVLCRPCSRHMLLEVAWDYTLLLVVVAVAAAASPSLLDDPCMWSALVADRASVFQPLASVTAGLSSTMCTLQAQWAAVSQQQRMDCVEQLVTLFVSHVWLTCLVMLSQQGSTCQQQQQQQLDCGTLVQQDRQLACTSLPEVCSSAIKAWLQCATVLSGQSPPDSCSTGHAPQEVMGQCTQCLLSIVATFTAAYNLFLLPDDQLLQQRSFVSYGSRSLTYFITARCEVAIEHLKAGDCMAATGAFLDLKERLGHRHISLLPDSFPLSQV